MNAIILDHKSAAELLSKHISQRKSRLEAVMHKIAGSYTGEPLYTNSDKSLVKFGNKKLPDTTAIFNLGPAKICPSMILGLCDIVNGCGLNKCYAFKAEKQYPDAFPYRYRQAAYWLNTSADKFAAEFIQMYKRKRKKPTMLRINESGDFWTQEDVYKINRAALLIWSATGVKTYVYSARFDLVFPSATAHNKRFINYVFSFDRSKLQSDNAIFVDRGVQFKAVDKTTFNSLQTNAQKQVYKCKADCRKCNLCAFITSGTIYAKLH